MTLQRKQVTAYGAWYVGSAVADGKMNGTFRTCAYGFGPVKLRVKGTLAIQDSRESPTGYTSFPSRKPRAESTASPR
jgi:hypothetical protein